MCEPPRLHPAPPSLLPGDREYIRDLKEKCCYVALDFDKEKAATPSLTRAWRHQLPDGREIDLGQEMFICMEALFQPDFIGERTGGHGWVDVVRWAWAGRHGPGTQTGGHG